MRRMTVFICAAEMVRVSGMNKRHIRRFLPAVTERRVREFFRKAYSGDPEKFIDTARGADGGTSVRCEYKQVLKHALESWLS